MKPHEITDEQRSATARKVFADPACQSAAQAVFRRLQDCASSATVGSLLFLAKTEADEENGNATPEQVNTWLNNALHFLADFSEINRELRAIEGR